MSREQLMMEKERVTREYTSEGLYLLDLIEAQKDKMDVYTMETNPAKEKVLATELRALSGKIKNSQLAHKNLKNRLEEIEKELLSYS